MSSVFRPVIYDDPNGMSVFRNDLIDIEFPLLEESVTKRFDLHEQLAPPIPFLRASTFPDGDKERVYVIDRMGDVWVDGEHGMMVWTIAEHFLILLMQIESPEFALVAEILRAFENSDFEYD